MPRVCLEVFQPQAGAPYLYAANFRINAINRISTAKKRIPISNLIIKSFELKFSTSCPNDWRWSFLNDRNFLKQSHTGQRHEKLNPRFPFPTCFQLCCGAWVRGKRMRQFTGIRSRIANPILLIDLILFNFLTLRVNIADDLGSWFTLLIDLVVW